MIFAVLFTACSKDGANGTDGVNGEQGIAGIDGTDGNANVSTYLFNEPQWSNGNPSIVLDMTGILTTEVVTNDVILVYLRRNFGNSERVFQIPGWVHGKFPNYPTQMVTPYFTDSEGGAGGSQVPERIYISTRSVDNQTIPSSEAIPLSWIKVVIIKATNIETMSGKGRFSKMTVLSKLKAAGVDVNNYNAVCNYYGICE